MYKGSDPACKMEIPAQDSLIASMPRPAARSMAALLVVAGVLGALGGVGARTQASAWTLVVLGIAQDGGIPHLGCQEERCVRARDGRGPVEKVASLGLVNRVTGAAYMFDATPDFPAQVHALTGGAAPDGIFLTHAHIGHYTGLMYLGREVSAASAVPVYGTARMVDFLTANGPWSMLVEAAHVALRTLTPGRSIELAPDLRVTSFLVPHRDEFTDTVGYRIDGPRAAAVYIPDVDRWDLWDRDIRDVVAGVDLAFLDGSFASSDELPGRSIDQIPHPLIADTRARLHDSAAAVWFIHLNHTNAELDGAPDVAREGMEFDL